jgi:hypothetical protein
MKCSLSDRTFYEFIKILLLKFRAITKRLCHMTVYIGFAMYQLLEAELHLPEILSCMFLIRMVQKEDKSLKD